MIDMGMSLLESAGYQTGREQFVACKMCVIRCDGGRI